MATRIQIRRDTTANWDSNNPILSEGEFGYAVDTDVLKLGDGSTAWTDLPEKGSSTALEIGSAVSGDLTGTAPDDLRIGAGKILDSHVSTGAGIARTKIATPEAPIEVGGVGAPAYEGTWSAYTTGGYQRLRYWLDPLTGMVHLDGVAKATDTDVTVFTLPTGYRPTLNHQFLSVRVPIPATPAVVVVMAIGAVFIAPNPAAATTFQSFSGISFRVAAS